MAGSLPCASLVIRPYLNGRRLPQQPLKVQPLHRRPRPQVQHLVLEQGQVQRLVAGRLSVRSRLAVERSGGGRRRRRLPRGRGSCGAALLHDRCGRQAARVVLQLDVGVPQGAGGLAGGGSEGALKQGAGVGDVPQA